MRGYGGGEGGPAGGAGRLKEHELLVAEAVGGVIEFWGFKRNQGRLWTLLYLRDRAMSAQELMEELDLSKGAVSMLTRELESWGVIKRVRLPGDSLWRFAAETDVLGMIGRVVRQREATVIGTAREQLEDALDLMRRDDEVSGGERERVERMRTVALLVEQAVNLFLKTAKLDVSDALSALRDEDEKDARGTSWQKKA